MSMQYDVLVAGNCFGEINVTTPLPPSISLSIDPNEILKLAEDLNYDLVELYQISRTFLKLKNKTTIKYEDNLRLIALSKQIHLGPWKSSYTENVGFLDVIGNDRKRAHVALGEMSKDESMKEYVKLVFQLDSKLAEYLDDQHRLKRGSVSHDKLNEHLSAIDNLHNQQSQELLDQHSILVNMEQQQQQQQTEIHPAPLTMPLPNLPNTSIPAVPHLGPAPAYLPPVIHPPPLNLPTTILSGSMPSPAEVASVIDSTVSVQGQFETLSLSTPTGPIPTQPAPVQVFDPSQVPIPSNDGTNGTIMLPTSTSGDPVPPMLGDGEAAVNTEMTDATKTGDTVVPITPANMWTRKDMKEFKEQIRKEKDAVIKVGSGETVTVRVPTHEDGRCIFWEFSTDYYDIGFGVYFEWSKAQSNTVTVHVSDSSEEEEEGEDGNNPEKKDIERGVGSTNKPPKPRQDEIVPICRRDCHEEVYAGSHPYPGDGVYLLKFDNSYSLWRSKTLYYRVYYSK